MVEHIKEWEPEVVGGAGCLVVNADDWGRDQDTTKRTLDCLRRKTVSAVSAMVFMVDSQRAAETALAEKIDVGIHLNFTTPFSAPECSSELRRQQRKLIRYLTRRPLNRVLFHPGLMSSFRYVYQAQMDEFERLFGRAPERIDGHHHMHLCSNVLFGGLVPSGTMLRRNCSLSAGEKNLPNRMYRKAIDRLIARRHEITDFLFSLSPCEPITRLQRIVSVAADRVVELEAHPVLSDEYNLLMSERMFELTGSVPILSFQSLRSNGMLRLHRSFAGA
jgi:predicted glycoside hydrolase/deacetylase ChbG (UPF0249 family)